VWSTVLWTVIDREDRRTAPGGPSGEHDLPPGGQGGFFRILGIIYLVKAIRRRREQRRLAQGDRTDET
jgi:hypothetical protein